ncbi:MAG: hypothetical protein JWP84_4533 [Tardiphaga sp.]|nr:hypothetical protein [Tardiphaga sp.]
MALTEARIRECTDEELSKLLSAELNRWLPHGHDPDLDLFLARLGLIPSGLRAMALIYQLDVSITLDDLGWHFANWHHRRYCEQTIWALRELEAFEHAELFVLAYALAQLWWDKIGELIRYNFNDFVAWYQESELEKATLPLTERMWELQKVDRGLFGYWTSYARKYPRKVIGT